MIAYSEAVGQLQANQDIFRFFKKMIAFRKLRPSLCRSRCWRDDIRWYGTGPVVDLSPDSRTPGLLPSRRTNIVPTRYV
jgi:pullulanase/glycogen debranching enzyme